ncbi:hypothetical protein [Amycolatopsis sp. GM8]|uniref:hypothetical protein n=1 Tax=Amycolatopsis sp. GM8 TaxID=2896530 RepID=UPI001F4482F9|nr:hypothetical protein [Amycolatopsis sp. GM8]
MDQISPQIHDRPDWLARLVERLDHWLFDAEDARAKARGWQVRRRGSGRVYRDPRWDLVHACAACAGEGCAACDGIGVIHDLPEPPPIPQPRESAPDRVRWEVRP